MSSIGYPSLEALVDIEVGTLRYLRTHGASHFPPLASAADTGYARAMGGKTGVDFEGHLDVEHEGRYLRVYVGCSVRDAGDGQHPLAVHHLAVCEGSKLLRKFHFDFDPGLEPRKPPAPLMHLQFGGERTPVMEDAGVDDGHLCSWLSEPRIPCTPVSLALIIHLVLTEFRSEVGVKFIRRPEWKKIVRNNERILLVRFAENCLEVLKDDARQPWLLFDFLYGDDSRQGTRR